MDDIQVVARIEPFPTRSDAASAAASVMVQALSEGIARRGFASLAAAGGATPCETYRLMSQSTLEWSRVAVTVTDDRMVPPNNRESRAGVVGRHLLSPRTRGVRFFPLWSAAANSQSAAFAADDAIRPLMRLDAALLGMDEAGAVAQLGNRSRRLTEAMEPVGRRLVVANGAGGLSLTLAALCATRYPTLLIFGDRKRQALYEAVERDAPIARLMAHSPLRVLWAA